MLADGHQGPAEVFQRTAIEAQGLNGHTANGGFTHKGREGFVPEKMVGPAHSARIEQRHDVTCYDVQKLRPIGFVNIATHTSIRKIISRVGSLFRPWQYICSMENGSVAKSAGDWQYSHRLPARAATRALREAGRLATGGTNAELRHQLPYRNVTQPGQRREVAQPSGIELLAFLDQSQQFGPLGFRERDLLPLLVE